MVEEAAHCHPRSGLLPGSQRKSLHVRLVTFLATESRGAAAITIVYRIDGDR